MYLKAINLKGFKSFPDRTKLSFDPGVSVIVGPNGCGKSNITDAVLWALGEQSPNAVRGNSMRDVIFAGGKGQSARRFAEVEVVIDNSEGRAASEFSEISITRRIERDGDGEYRLNGARCRLADILEVLSDTNMGREMHSVISQGRVEQIVNSKPRERRLLIEEAAGLGKHRKRRHRAQLKLDRARDNLDRALDVEREARSRLRPLKRQAEAAERTAKLVAQEDELRAVVVAADLREQEDQLGKAEAGLIEIRGRRDGVESRLEEVRVRRAAIEERVASGEDERRKLGQRLAEARGALERVRARAEAVESAGRDLRAGLGERQLRLTELDDEPGHGGRRGRADRRARGRARSAEAGRGRGRPRARRAPGRRGRRPRRLGPSSQTGWPEIEAAAAKAAEAFARATQVRDAARAEAEKANQRLAALQGELGAVEAKLARAAMEGSDEVLAGMIETGPGVERALSAALGERLRAAVVGSLGEGVGRLRDSEGASRALVAGSTDGAAAGRPDPAGRGRPPPARPGPGRRAPRARSPQRLLHDAWLVDDLEEVPADFRGIAVTVDGDAFDGSFGELRRLPREGTDPALAARSAREELVNRIAQREQTAERNARELERADEALARPRPSATRTDLAMRDARRALGRGRRGGAPDRLARRAPRRARRRRPADREARAARGRAGRRAPPRRGRREGRRGPPPRPGAPAPPDLARERDAARAGPRHRFARQGRRGARAPLRAASAEPPARAAAARSPPSFASAPSRSTP